MKKLNIYIARHGEKIGDEKGLTGRGKKQALALANKLKKLNITKIYSSDLQRTKETAEIIGKKLGLLIKYEPHLREVPSEVKENPKKHKKEVRIIKKFWNKIRNSTGNILLVAHGNVNRILISLALKIDPKKANFTQYPTGLTKIEKNRKKKRYRIWHINDTSHLTDKLRVLQK